MEWIEQFAGNSIGLDTAPVIYYIENVDPYKDVANLFFESLAAGDYAGITSELPF